MERGIPATAPTTVKHKAIPTASRMRPIITETILPVALSINSTKFHRAINGQKIMGVFLNRTYNTIL